MHLVAALLPAPAGHCGGGAAAQGRESNEELSAAAGQAARAAGGAGRAAGGGGAWRAGAGAFAAGGSSKASRWSPAGRVGGCRSVAAAGIPWHPPDACPPAAHPHAAAPCLQDRSFACLHFYLDASGRLHSCTATDGTGGGGGGDAAGAAAGCSSGAAGSGGSGEARPYFTVEQSNVQLGVMVRKGVGGTCPLRWVAPAGRWAGARWGGGW